MKQFRDSDYYVTEEGDVYSKKYNPRYNKNCELRKMKLRINKEGYHQINLIINGKPKCFRVHRLIAEVYIPNPDNLPLVEHKDDIKTNNHVSNLMWSTHNKNMKTAIMNNRIKSPKGEKHGYSKLTNEQVKWIRDNYIFRHPEFGGVALTKKFGVKNAQISRIVNNKLWKHL